MATHPLAAVAKRRDRVVRAILSTTSGAQPLDAARAAEVVLLRLPPGCQLAAVYQSLLPFHGRQPDPTDLRSAAWAIAANLRDLKAGRPVYPTQIPKTPTPAIFQVLAATRVPRRFRQGQPSPEPRSRYRLRIVAGAGVTLEVEVTWSDKFVRYVATHPTGLGFRSSRPKPGTHSRPFLHPDTLVGMLFRAKVALSDDGRTELTSVGCTGGQRDYNRALTELRWRAGGFQCPFSFANHCHDCPKGQTSCPAACRPSDLVPVDHCPSCRTPGHTDPAWPAGGVCTRCAAAARHIPLPQRNPT